MTYVWRKAVIAIGSVLVAGAIAATIPGEAHAAAKAESLRVYIDGNKSQLQAQHYDGNTYISASGALALGVKVQHNENGSYTIESGRQSINAAKNDVISINNQLHVKFAAIADSLGAKWVEDRLTSSLFVFQRSSGKPSGSTAGLPPPDAANPISNSPSPGSSVTLSDAVPTLSGIIVDDGAVYVNATGNINPKIFQLRSPERIVIDLPGTSLERNTDGSAEGAVTVDADNPYISSIRYAQFEVEPATVRIVLDMKQPTFFRLEQSADGTSTAIRFVEKQFRIMIDPGHGGSDPGAISKSGKYEKDMTLTVARKTVALMEKEKLLTAVPVRLDDVYSSPSERAQQANQSGIDLYVSIHGNTASASSVQGSETYYWREDSRRLAEVIHSNIVDAVGSEDRKVKKNNFLVVRETVMPAVLLELGFLSNLEDEAKLYDELVQERIAAAIVTSIKQYYNIP